MKNKLVVLIMLLVSVSGFGSDMNSKDSVTQMNKKIEMKIWKEILPSAVEFRIKERKGINDLDFVPGYNKKGEKIGYVVFVTEFGYNDDIQFIVGVKNNKEVSGLKIVYSAETPGLGERINEKRWQKHWIGKDKNYKFKKSVDAFAGATISPKAVYDGIRRALIGVGKIETVK